MFYARRQIVSGSEGRIYWRSDKLEGSLTYTFQNLSTPNSLRLDSSTRYPIEPRKAFK